MLNPIDKVQENVVSVSLSPQKCVLRNVHWTYHESCDISLSNCPMCLQWSCMEDKVFDIHEVKLAVHNSVILQLVISLPTIPDDTSIPAVADPRGV